MQQIVKAIAVATLLLGHVSHTAWAELGTPVTSSATGTVLAPATGAVRTPIIPTPPVPSAPPPPVASTGKPMPSAPSASMSPAPSAPISHEMFAQDQTLIQRLPHGEMMPPAEFLRQFNAFLEKPTVPQPIAPQLFQDFWLKWGLVTTRYKPDGTELRFIYANKIAAEALAKGEYPFPEGSVLTKIGAKAMLDPSFSNSLVPGSIERIQVMLKKANDPNARDGWVYALYTEKYRGQLTNDEINACQACHLLVPERDMVFSQPFPTAFGAAMANFEANEPFVDKFQPVMLDKLKPNIQEVLRQQTPVPQKVMLLEMPTFSGTIFESREIITRLTRKNNMTYVLSAPDGSEFLMNIPEAGNQGCVKAINTLSGPPPINWKAVVGQPQKQAPPQMKNGKPMVVSRRNCVGAP